MPQLIASIVLIALAAAAGWFAMLKLRSGRYRRLVALAKAGDAAGFEKCLSTNFSRMLVSPFAKGKLRLELAAAQGRRKEVREAVNEAMKLKLTDSQRSQIATRAFTVLAKLGDRNGCKRLLEEIEGTMPHAAARYRCYFDTVMCGLGAHAGSLEQSLSELEGTPARKTRGHTEYLLSLAYRANGDGDRADAMRARAARDLNVNVDELEGAIDVSSCL